MFSNFFGTFLTTIVRSAVNVTSLTYVEKIFTEGNNNGSCIQEDITEDTKSEAKSVKVEKSTTLNGGRKKTTFPAGIRRHQILTTTFYELPSRRHLQNMIWVDVYKRQQ